MEFLLATDFCLSKCDGNYVNKANNTGDDNAGKRGCRSVARLVYVNH